jgi:hypothetical protein
LRRTGLALGSLGIGGTALLASSSRYQQALAKPARRRLALLIGINAYTDRALDPGIAQDVALRGCLTDVDLQRQLLVHRFGFQPGDVLTLTNQEATRSGILTAIDEHLGQQAQAEDVVLLHFSGYGSQVRRFDANDRGAVYPVWVPADGRLPSEENPVLGDVLEAEVAARLGRLATANITTVIDAGSQDAGYLRWGNSRVRSRPTVPTGVLPPAAADLDLATPWPGLLLRAADPGRLVLESQWDGFSAGVFTYALTQSLWEADPGPAPQGAMVATAQRLQRWIGSDQQPVLGDRLPPSTGPGAYGQPPPMPAAEGVLLPGGGDRPAAVWLGGVPPLVLRYLQPGSRLGAGDDPIGLRLEVRSGLRATVRPIDGPLPAARLPVYEQVRVLPQAIGLVVALDSQLKRVERVDATSALAGIPLVTSVAAGERAADCLFGRLPIGPTPTLTAALPGGGQILPEPGDARGASLEGERPAESSYGLFAPNRTLLPGTMLAKDEAVKTAVNRLAPYLQMLLAQKLVRLSENALASRLPVAALLEAVQPKARPLLVQSTLAPPVTAWPLALRQAQKALATPAPVLLPRDSRIGYRVVNGSVQPLHLLWISFDSRGDCTALMTLADPDPATEASPAALPLSPGQMLSLPVDEAGWAMPGAATWVEAYLVLSTQPFERCRAALGDGPPSLVTGFRPVAQPLKLAQALLQDLGTPPGDGKAADTYALDHDRWATLSFRYSIA